MAVLGVTSLLVLGGPSVVSAQARALASPVRGGASPSTTPSTAPATSPAVASAPGGAQELVVPAAPPAYDQVSVPPAPTAGIYAAPRAPVVADASDVHIPTTVATRLRALDADLQILAARGGGSILDGVLMLVSAAATVTWGVLLDTSGSLPPGSVSYSSIYLYTYAGASAARAISSFILMTNPSAPAIRFAHMPMGSLSEVRERLEYGELQLDSLADQARIGRILDGSINLAVGLAVVPVYLGPNNFQVPNPADWFIIVLAGVSSVMGVVTLVSTTEAERRQSAYHELRDRILATPEGTADEDALATERAEMERSIAGVDVSPILSVSPTGGFAGATLTF